MKVITEESFKRAEVLVQNDALIRVLRDSFQELDTLTVSKLRPMSEAKKDGTEILVYVECVNGFINGFFANGEWYFNFKIGNYDLNDVKGWIPMPIYKPEEPTKEMIWPNSCG